MNNAHLKVGVGGLIIFGGIVLATVVSIAVFIVTHDFAKEVVVAMGIMLPAILIGRRFSIPALRSLGLDPNAASRMPKTQQRTLGFVSGIAIILTIALVGFVAQYVHNVLEVVAFAGVSTVPQSVIGARIIYRSMAPATAADLGASRLLVSVYALLLTGFSLQIMDRLLLRGSLSAFADIAWLDGAITAFYAVACWAIATYAYFAWRRLKDIRALE